MLLGTQDKDFFPEDLIEKFKFVKNMGFECFEIDGKVLTDNVETVKQAIKESGLPVSSACGGYRGWIGGLYRGAQGEWCGGFKRDHPCLEGSRGNRCCGTCCLGYVHFPSSADGISQKS